MVVASESALCPLGAVQGHVDAGIWRPDRRDGLGYLVASWMDASTVMNLVLSAAGIVFGVKGNAWREARLIKRAYGPVATVLAEDARSADALVPALKTRPSSTLGENLTLPDQ